MNESEVGAQPGPWWATPPGAPATLSHTPGRPAQSGARFLLQQQLAAGQPQAVLAQSGPLLFRLQAQRVGRAGPTASCRAGMAEGQGWGSREARAKGSGDPSLSWGAAQEPEAPRASKVFAGQVSGSQGPGGAGQDGGCGEGLVGWPGVRGPWEGGRGRVSSTPHASLPGAGLYL